MPPNLNIRISNIRIRPQSSRSRASRDLCGRIPGPSEVSEIVDPRLTLLARGEERLVEDHELTAAGEIGIEADITARTTAVNEHARLDNVMGAGKSGIDDSAVTDDFFSQFQASNAPYIFNIFLRFFVIST